MHLPSHAYMHMRMYEHMYMGGERATYVATCVYFCTLTSRLNLGFPYN